MIVSYEKCIKHLLKLIDTMEEPITARRRNACGAI
jgi:hypothetical protein